MHVMRDEKDLLGKSNIRNHELHAQLCNNISLHFLHNSLPGKETRTKPSPVPILRPIPYFKSQMVCMQTKRLDSVLPNPITKL